MAIGNEAALSLGSNLGDRLQALRTASSMLARHPMITLLQTSPCYETDPVDAPEEFAHQSFINLVVVIETSLAPQELLGVTQGVERDLGRRADLGRNHPRIIDVDIIYYENLRVDLPALEIPHPRAHLRRFVLRPLADLRPNLIMRGQEHTVQELLNSLPATPGVRLLTSL